MSFNIQPFHIPKRLLMGPGPSPVHPSVLEKMSCAPIGHLDPFFLSLMEEIKTMLRAVFQTSNEFTFPISGTGSAGMEFCLVNLIEPQDRVLVGINGLFGRRIADLAIKLGAEVKTLEVPWGQSIEVEQLKEAITKERPKVVALVHAETSTGICNPMEELAPIVAESGALFILDTVTSLGGSPVFIDQWKVDATFSATQKCIGSPPGLSPVSFSPRALEVIAKRKTKIPSWYFDCSLLYGYWGHERLYHHTAPINNNYGLHQSLRLILEEGLQNRWQRHYQAHLMLKEGLAQLGLKFFTPEDRRLWQLNAITVPDEKTEAFLRKKLLDAYEIEIGPGLGPLKGKIWRIGLMAEGARKENIERLLEALKKILSR
ncbi:alanine--glyoxylate aminotransferase [Methylacidiphilum sp. Yel]|jgi:alanine-glyoxylate transaminase/serine-glyoxylate transaminase/serine-pyruvate transaminase|uniref:pyridoxal-phosphate-dependent aminotransferase family protein n=1 Tax=Methylacidiphilum sp. Yel TaxID=1847730 RepID=UPI00106AF181|nr:alanine--glyoxylate aminotransferase family protein [Methylacidiphilum sp. Yel]TFE67248.1 alanine--glyoxylate aminotransferase [Methylacidiphilum sp. Yel]